MTGSRLSGNSHPSNPDQGKRDILRIVFSAGLLFLIAGCATPRQTQSRYLQRLAPGSLTNLVAYHAGTNLVLRFSVPGKDPVAHAEWVETQAATSANSQADARHEFVALTFEDPEFATRRMVMQRGHRVPVRGPAQWHQLVQDVFSATVPTQRGHGVALLVQSQEMVVFRDDRGRLNAVNLPDKPPGIVVDRTLKDEDFSRQVLATVAAGLKGRERDQTQFLFVTGDDPAFAFVDLRERLMVFLSYPPDPESGPLEVPGFALRALSSLVFKSFLLAAIKNPFTLIGRGFWHIGSSGAALHRQ